MGSEAYRCREAPCIHVVIDDNRGVFKVFVEDRDVIIPVPLERVRELCERLVALRSKQGLREANERECDFLAKRYLDAEPLEEA